ncbi:MAG: hypothetical protein ACLUIX_03510 [Oscillospiraceae bacterium]
MQENRSIAPGLGAFRLTLQRRENGFCGYVYSAAWGWRSPLWLAHRPAEEWMNTATDSPVPKSPPAAAPMWSWRSGCAGITAGRGGSVT